jgi:hypothetical protein
MSLNPSSCASAIDSANDSAISTWPSSNFATDFANAYKDYSQGGDVVGAASGSEDSSILQAFLSTGDFVTDADFGQALADYWSTCKLVPSGGSVSVSNDAASKVAAFTAAVTSSYSTTLSTPHYLNFITNIETVAKTIIWTVVYPNPAPPSFETIS